MNRWIMIRHLRWKNVQKWIKRSEQRSGRMFSSVTRRRQPGSASVAGLLTDEDDYVQVIIDKEVAEAEWFGCNPGINTSHLKFKTKDLLQKYLPAIHHRARIVDL